MERSAWFVLPEENPEEFAFCIARENVPGFVKSILFARGTWEQANAFTDILNAGLKITRAEADQIIMSTMPTHLLYEWAKSRGIELPEDEDTAFKRIQEIQREGFRGTEDVAKIQWAQFLSMQKDAKWQKSKTPKN